MADTRSVRAAAPILIGAAVMLSVAMGVRQSLGLVMPPLTRDLAISVSEFTLALSVQNLAWGALQPLHPLWTAALGQLIARRESLGLGALPSGAST